MAGNLLRNGGFEADWSEDKSHRCMIFPEGAVPYEKDVGNIFVPPGWTFWFHHVPGKWDQPEARDSWKEKAPERVHGGEKAFMWFTFGRGHDAGLLQQVSVTAGSKLRFTAWLHAWSNHKGDEDDFPHPSDGAWSEGAGYEKVAWEEGTLPGDTGDPQEDAKVNFTLWVGIDPTGGTDPFADTVAWGKGYHIYNGYVKQLEAEATAQAGTVTVFIRSRALWPFKHSDAYVDDARLVVVGQEPVVEPPPEALLSHRPVNLKVGDVATLEARSLAALTDVKMTVAQPSGAELARGTISAGRDGDWHTWTCTTSPLREPGAHTVRFSAAGGVAVASTFDCAPEVRLSYRPAEPEVGKALVVEARSLVGLTNVKLTITQPSGAVLALGGVAVGRDGDWHIWTYTTSPVRQAGTHTAKFAASDGVQAAITFDCRAVVQPPPSTRGRPREQYARTYVLLPPDADVSWALAVVSGMWNDRRYTIGGSADDAGIGDLDVRSVIAVNPQKWPDDLRAFFKKYYPGVEYVAVEASSPAELTQKLKQL